MFEMNFSKFSSEQIIYFSRDIGIPNDFYPNKPYILRALMYRQQTNMNSFVLVVGNPRTSKSYCAMKLSEEYAKMNDSVFDVREQLTYSDIKKFLTWSQSKTNSVFILDETGTTLSPDQFWSLQQRVMRRFVQTQGFRKNVLFWVLPSICFIQKGFRFMCNYAIKTRKQGVVDVYKIVVDQLLGKGFPDRIEAMTFGLPEQRTLDIYEQMKREWNDIELKSDLDFIAEMEQGYRPQIKGTNAILLR